MEAAYPYVPIGSSLRISVAIFSYLDTISFGVTADYDAVPDLEILIEGIGRGPAELGGQPAAGPPVDSAAPKQAAPKQAAAPKPAARKSGAKPAVRKSGAAPKPGSGRPPRGRPATS